MTRHRTSRLAIVATVVTLLGAGQAAQWLRGRDVRLGRVGLAAGALTLALWVGYQSLGRVSDLRDLHRQREDTLARIAHGEHKKKEKTVDPCWYADPRFDAQHAGTVPILPTVVHYMKLRYHLPDPSCVSQG